MANKNTVVTEHILDQKVILDDTGITRARRTHKKLIEDIEKVTKDSNRAIYQNANSTSTQLEALNIRRANKAVDLTKYGVTEYAKGNLARLASSKNTTAQIISDIVKVEVALKRANVALLNTKNSSVSNSANPGGSSTQGGIAFAPVPPTVTPSLMKASNALLSVHKSANTASASVATTSKSLQGLGGASQVAAASTMVASNSLTSLTKANVSASTSTVTASKSLQGMGGATQMATTGLAKQSVATKQLSKDTHGLFSTMQRAAITVPAFYGVASAIMMVHKAIGAAITRTIEFDLASRTLAAVLSGQSLMATREAAKEFTNLSTVLGGTIADYETASLLLARSGIGDKVLNDLTKAVGITAKLSLITGESLELAASAIITFKQAYSKGAEGLEAYGGALEDIGDKIAFMANASKLSLQDIGTFSNYAVAAGKAAGLTQDSLNGMAIAFSNAGNKASTIGTQIRRFTATLTSSREGVIKLYESIGINRAKLNADMQKSKSGLKEDIKSSNDAFKEFVLSVAALDQVGYNQATAGMAILDKQFFDNLRNNSAEILENVETSFNGVSGALDKTGIMADSLGKRWEAMGNKLIIGSQDSATSVASFFTDMTEQYLEWQSKWVNLGTGDELEADVNVKASKALDEMIVGRKRLAELQYENIFASKEQVKINNKESNIILSNISLKKAEISLLKQQADADSYSILNAGKRGKFTNDQLLNLDLVRAKLEVNNQISNEASDEDIKNAKDKVNNIKEAQKYIREELNEKKRISGVEHVATVRAKESLGYDKLSTQEAENRVEAFKKLIEAQSQLNLKRPTDKGDMDSTKSFIALTNEAEAHARIEQHIQTNVDALAKSEKQIIDNADATIGQETAQALLVLSLSKEGKHREANIQLNALEFKLSKSRSVEARNLLSIITSMKPVMGEILNYNVLDAKITAEKARHQKALETSAIKRASINSKISIAAVKLLGVQGALTREQVALNVATKKHEEAIASELRAKDKYTTLAKKGIDLTANQVAQNKQAEEIEKARLAVHESSLVVLESSTGEVKALTANAYAMSDAILKASNNSITLASNLRSAVTAFNNMVRTTQVLNGTMTAYHASVAQNQEALGNAREKVNDIDKKAVAIQKELSKTSDEEALKGQKRTDREKDLTDLVAERIKANAQMGVIQSAIAKGAQDEYKAKLEHDAAMASNSARQLVATSAVLEKKERKVAASRAEIIELEKAVTLTKKLDSAPTAGRSEELAASNAITALAERRKQLAEEELDLKTESSKTDRAGMIADRNASLEISQALKKAEINNVLLEQEAALLGIILTKTQQNEMDLLISEAAVVEAQKAYDIAAATKTPKTGEKTDLKILSAQLKLEKAKLKLYKDQNKVALETAKSMKKAGDALFDSLAAGDLKGAMKGLMNDVANLFIEPLKDSFSTLFGNTMSTLMSPMVDGLNEMLGNYVKETIGSKETVAVATIALDKAVGAETVATNVAVGAKSIGPSIATSGAMGGYPMALLMIGLLAAVGMGSMGSAGPSEAELNLAAGQDSSEYTDESLDNMADALEDAQYPLLKATYEMSNYLRSMDKNFYDIARAIGGTSAASGIDITGGNVIEGIYDGGLMSTKSVDLIGAGLVFQEQSLAAMANADALYIAGYESIQTTKEYLWKTSIKLYTDTFDLPDDVVEDFASAFSNGYETLMTAGVALGMDEADLEASLAAATITLGDEEGKIDLSGLDDAGVADALNNIFGTAFSQVVDQIGDFDKLVERYASGTEDSLETLLRIAYEYEQASHSFSLIGKTFTDSAMTSTLVTWTEEIITGATDGINSLDFADAYGSESDMYGIATVFSDLGFGITTAIETFTELVYDSYTAQEKMLDVVAASGGIDAFNDAMGAYMSGFYTEDEQMAMLEQSLSTQFDTLADASSQLNGSLPETNVGFRELLEGFEILNEEDAITYAGLLALSEGFAELNPLMDELEAILTTLTDAALFTDLMSTVTDLTSREIALTGDDTAIAEYGVTSAEIMLDAIEAQTDLHGVTMDNYFDQLEAAHLAGDLTSEQLDEWSTLGDALMNVEEATKAYTDVLEDQAQILEDELIASAQAELDFHLDILGKIEDAYTGTLSYLTSLEKSAYLDTLAQVQLDSGDTQSYLDTLLKQLEYDKATSITKEDYIGDFERYIYELQNAEPEEDPVVAKLDEILEQNKDIEEAIANSSYQASLTPIEVRVIETV